MIHNPEISKYWGRSSTYRLHSRCTLLLLRNKKQMRVGKQSRKHPPSTLLSSESTWQGGREKEKHSLSSMQTRPCLCMFSSCKAPNSSCKCSIAPIQRGKNNHRKQVPSHWQHLRNRRQNFSNTAGYRARSFHCPVQSIHSSYMLLAQLS